jgi:hypothetical protein
MLSNSEDNAQGCITVIKSGYSHSACPLVPLDNSWQAYFFKYQFQMLHSTILTGHIERIQQAVTQPNDPLIALINNEVFWNNLRVSNKYDAQIDQLQALWKEIQPLIHLNSQQLITLLQDEIAPLDLAYENILTDLTIEQEKCDNQVQWRPQWYTDALKKIIGHFTANRKNLATLKCSLHQQLVLRCQSHLVLKAGRNVDDLLADFCTRVNNLQVLKSPLQMPVPLSEKLDDDQRITIFDILKKTTTLEKNLKKIVLSPIAVHTNASLCAKVDIEKELNEINQFTQAILDSLSLVRKREKLTYIEDLYNQYAKKKVELISNALSRKLDQWFGKTFFSKMMLLGYAIALYCSLYVYHQLIPLLYPGLFLLMGKSLADVISLGLFIVVGFAPLTWVAWKNILSIKAQLQKIVLYWKREEIVDALLTLKETQIFIASKLSHNIIDIAHFDIQYLQTRVDFYQQQLARARAQLERFFFWERKFCPSIMQEQIDAIIAKIAVQKSKIDSQLKLVTAQVSNHIGQSINSTHSILSEQIVKLKAFVAANADPSTQDQFNHNTNVIKQWLHSIENDELLVPKQFPDLYKLPWGHFTLRIDSLAGWENIVKPLAANETQKQAVIMLNRLLMGTLQLSKQQLSETVNMLGLGKEATHAMRLIQRYLFNTLDARPPEVASLLSQEHKKTIVYWYSQNQGAIESAKQEINSMLKATDAQCSVQLAAVSDQKLAQSYTLLDADAICNYAINKNATDKPQDNQIKQFYRDYQGQSSRAYILLKLVSPQEQATLIPVIAAKRLQWICAHLGKEIDPLQPFETVDSALFHCPDLDKIECTFDFVATIANSVMYQQPWCQTMHDFLASCKNACLGSADLINNYNNKKPLTPSVLDNYNKNNARSGDQPTTTVSEISTSMRKNSYA